MDKKICIITTISLSIDQFIRPTFDYYHKNGYSVSIMCDMDQEYMQTLPSYINPIPISMRRGIHIAGILAMLKMYMVFKKEEFVLVQYSTPNASLYASIASYLARVPIRLYCNWGMVFETFTGIKRAVFIRIEQLICKLSTDIQPVSLSNLKLFKEMNFCNEKNSEVIWNGSANGVDLSKFDIKKKYEYRQEVRSKYNLLDNDIVIGYLGRLMKDKGFNELIGAFKILKEKFPELKMLFVGPSEKTDREDANLFQYYEGCKDIIKINDFVLDTERYYSAMDIFVFPSHREGFGLVVIEAQAMGLPLVITEIPGPIDGVKRDKTAFIVPAKEVLPLVKKIEMLICDKDLRSQMGRDGREFVQEQFDSKVLLGKIIENRNWLISKQQPVKPRAVETMSSFKI